MQAYSSNFVDTGNFKSTRKKLYTIHGVYVKGDEPIATKLKEMLQRGQQIGAKLKTNVVSTAGGGLQVKNVLEDAVYNIYTKGDPPLNAETRILLIGTVGEFWGVPLKKVLTQYTRADGRPLTPADFKANEVITLQSNPGNLCFASFIPKNLPVSVQTAWGDILIANRPGIPHGDGDFLVCNAGPDGRPNRADTWVVNGAVFKDTYAMNSFTDLKKLGEAVYWDLTDPRDMNYNNPRRR